MNYLTVNPLARRGVMLDWNCISALHIWVRLRLKFVPMHEGFWESGEEGQERTIRILAYILYLNFRN